MVAGFGVSTFVPAWRNARIARVITTRPRANDPPPAPKRSVAGQATGRRGSGQSHSHGDREGLTELYRAFGRRVLGLCRHLLGSPEAAEDALALGRALLRPRGDARRDALRALVVGLALVTLATALPVVGWPIWAAVACLGAGALAGRVARAAGAVRSLEV